MKLRIRENTIRLRLKQNEVAQVAAGQSIVEETRFPASTLTCSLQVSDDDTASANFEQGTLAIYLPAADVARWAGSDQVSIVAEQAVDASDTLSLLIEKDFKCLSPGHHRPGEDDVDTYPHPEAAGGGC
jgi:hypothetical protein